MRRHWYLSLGLMALVACDTDQQKQEAQGSLMERARQTLRSVPELQRQLEEKLESPELREAALDGILRQLDAQRAEGQAPGEITEVGVAMMQKMRALQVACDPQLLPQLSQLAVQGGAVDWAKELEKAQQYEQAVKNSLSYFEDKKVLVDLVDQFLKIKPTETQARQLIDQLLNVRDTQMQQMGNELKRMQIAQAEHWQKILTELKNAPEPWKLNAQGVIESSNQAWNQQIQALQHQLEQAKTKEAELVQQLKQKEALRQQR